MHLIAFAEVWTHWRTMEYYFTKPWHLPPPLRCDAANRFVALLLTLCSPVMCNLISFIVCIVAWVMSWTWNSERRGGKRRGNGLDLCSLIGHVAICSGRVHANTARQHRRESAKRIICRSLCTVCYCCCFCCYYCCCHCNWTGCYARPLIDNGLLTCYYF